MRLRRLARVPLGLGDTDADGRAAKQDRRDLLDKVVGKLDKLDMGDRDTKGDVYEYMLAKIASAGQNGQFCTPRHIIATMIASTNMTQPHNFPVLLPPLDLQRAFAAGVTKIDKLKAHHRAHLAKLDALFASLQHRAFRGEL